MKIPRENIELVIKEMYEAGISPPWYVLTKDGYLDYDEYIELSQYE